MTPSLRTLTRIAVAASLVGATLLGAAWAGIGLAPVDLPAPGPGERAATPAPGQGGGPGSGTPARSRPPELVAGERLPDGYFLVGADVTSLAPEPPEGASWKTEGCPQIDQGPAGFVEHLHTPLFEQGRVGWPVDPACIYLGGYGIGPARAATGVDDHAGVNVRSIAISNGVDTVVWQTVDMVGLFSHYRPELCDACGIAGMRAAIAEAAGIPVANVAVGSTHTHGGADGYGAWGGLPRWYREQIRDRVVASGLAAIAGRELATIEIGAVDARTFNNERRDLYHSTPDYGAVWMQARAVSRHPRSAGRVIATLVNYAAHPTVLGAGNTLLHGDWPATASKALGDVMGGVGVVFVGGLGNVSPSGGGVVAMGDAFARFLAQDIERGGSRLASNDVTAVSAEITHPVTNAVLAGLGVAGLLDRDFSPGPAAGLAGAYEWRKHPSSPRGCVTASPLTVKTEVSGFRVGELTVLTTPGEIFSSISLVLKSKARHAADRGGQTMVFAQVQDSLGYVIPSYEVDVLGGLLEYVPEVELAEYEETFMVDRCLGDHVLDTALQVRERLGP